MTPEETRAAGQALRSLTDAHAFARDAGVRPPPLDELLARLAPGLTWGHPLVVTLIDADRALRRQR